jgi:5-carboxymethyl-2-hydroxymuconate isomerase
MAHAVVEWTSNLKGEADIHGLLELIAAAMRNSGGVFPWGGIRVRAIRLDDYVIADGKADDAFVNVTVKMAAGRSAEFKKAFFTDLFEQIKAHFAGLCDRRYLALSLYVEEADEAGSFKHNNIHTRFKKEP